MKLHLITALVLMVSVCSFAEPAERDYSQMDQSALVTAADALQKKLDQLDKLVETMDAPKQDKADDMAAKIAAAKAQIQARKEAEKNGEADPDRILLPSERRALLLKQMKQRSPFADLPKAELVTKCRDLEAEIDAREAKLGQRLGGEISNISGTVVYVQDGEWLVEVVENREPDPAEKQAEIAQLRRELTTELPRLRSELSAAQSEKARAERELASSESDYKLKHEKYKYTERLKSGASIERRKYRWSSTYRNAATRRRAAAKRAASAASRRYHSAKRKLQVTENATNTQIARLERELQQMEGSRQLIVKMPDDQKLDIVVPQAVVQRAAAMRPGQSYLLVGRARVDVSTDAPPKITMTDFKPAPPDAAAPSPEADAGADDT